MKPISKSILVAVAVVFLAACANDAQQTTSAGGAAEFVPFSQRLNQEQGYKQDAEGNWVPRSDRRSTYDERKEARVKRRNFQNNQRYQTHSYQTAEWTRNRSEKPKPYAGPTDGSEFQISAAADGQVARQSGVDSGLARGYDTRNYRTGNAREDQGRRMPKKPDTQTEKRRDNLPPVDVIDWREQRKMTIEQSRSLLSR